MIFIKVSISLLIVCFSSFALSEDSLKIYKAKTISYCIADSLHLGATLETIKNSFPNCTEIPKDCYDNSIREYQIDESATCLFLNDSCFDIKVKFDEDKSDTSQIFTLAVTLAQYIGQFEVISLHNIVWHYDNIFVQLLENQNKSISLELQDQTKYGIMNDKWSEFRDFSEQYTKMTTDEILIGRKKLFGKKVMISCQGGGGDEKSVSVSTKAGGTNLVNVELDSCSNEVKLHIMNECDYSCHLRIYGIVDYNPISRNASIMAQKIFW